MGATRKWEGLPFAIVFLGYCVFNRHSNSGRFPGDLPFSSQEDEAFLVMLPAEVQYGVRI